MGDRSPRELPAGDRSALEESSVFDFETVEPGCEERIDRRGHRLELLRPRLLEEGEQLLGEQRISFG